MTNAVVPNSVTVLTRNPSREDIGRALGDVRHQIGNLEFRFRGGERSVWAELVKLYNREDELAVTYGIIAGNRQAAA